MKDSFDKHSKNYSSRVEDRVKYANLSVEDKIIATFLIKRLSKYNKYKLLDAACGSGDRLRILIEEFGLARVNFDQIVGIDYVESMLQIASRQRTGGKSLYDDLKKQDLLDDMSRIDKSDVILCLWEVTNSIGLDSHRAVENMASRLNNKGFLIYDMITTKAQRVLAGFEEKILAEHQELKKDRDLQKVWYERDDGSIGYLRMFTPSELNGLLEGPGLTTLEVWGYSHKDLVPNKLSVVDGRIDEVEAEKFTGILVIQQR